MMLSPAALFALACLYTGDVAFPATFKGWIGFAGVPLTYSLAIIGTMAAVSAVGAMKTSFYLNFDPVATIVLAALVLDQYMTPIQLAGAVLVIVATSIFRTPAAAQSPDAQCQPTRRVRWRRRRG
jgi:drug/metabolite transporter (DMT)-like permease